MTPEQAKELLPIMEAFANGKTIQVRSSYVADLWEDCVRFHASSNCEYRIKPKPREFLLVAIHRDGLGTDIEVANGYNVDKGKLFKVREVLE